MDGFKCLKADTWEMNIILEDNYAAKKISFFKTKCDKQMSLIMNSIIENWNTPATCQGFVVSGIYL